MPDDADGADDEPDGTAEPEPSDGAPAGPRGELPGGSPDDDPDEVPDEVPDGPRPLLSADRRSTIERVGRHAWSIVGIGIAAAFAVVVLSQLDWIVGPAVVAVVMSTLALPLVALLQRRGMRRPVATLLSFLLIVGVLVGGIVVVAPPFASQIGRLAIDLPGVVEEAASSLDRFEERIAESSSSSVVRAIERFRGSLTERSGDAGSSIAASVIGLFGSFAQAFGSLLIGTVIAILVVKDLPKYAARGEAWLRRPDNRRAGGALRSAGRSTAAFIRGQLSVAVVIGACKTLVLWLLGIPYFVPLGVLSGVANIVPGIGPVLATIPPVVIAGLSGGWRFALLTFVSLAVVQLLDWAWLSPRFVNDRTALPTLAVLLALLAGALIAGLGGLIIAIPVAASLRDVVHWYALPDDEVEGEWEALDEPAGPPRRRRRRPATDTATAAT